MKFKSLVLTAGVLACHAAKAQSFFGGYTIGKYLLTEPAPEVLAAKFNLGWDVSISDDNRELKMVVGSGNYSLEKPFEWRSCPYGATFGAIFGEDNMGVMVRLSFLNNKSGGGRTNLDTGLKESLSLKTRSTTLSFNFLFMGSEFIQPYVGFDIGRNTMSYWYDNSLAEIKRTRLGYRTTISAQYKPGGVGFNMRLNAGAVVRIFQADGFGAKAIVQYQYVPAPLSGDINTWSGQTGTITPPNYYFSHTNLSLSLALSLGI